MPSCGLAARVSASSCAPGQDLVQKSYLGDGAPALGLLRGERSLGEGEVAGTVEAQGLLPGGVNAVAWDDAEGQVREIGEDGGVRGDDDVSEQHIPAADRYRAPFTAAMIGISRSTSRCITRRASAMGGPTGQAR